MRYLFLAIIICTIAGCSTDVDLTAPYKESTVVYGLLDQSATRQYVKINKTFLGDVAVTEMAAIRDSIQYETEQFSSKRIEEWNGNSKTNEWELQEIQVEAVNEGIFYVEGITDPERTVYYFDEGDLNEDREYRLVVEFENKDEVVEATTDLISNSSNALVRPRSNLAGQANNVQNIQFAGPSEGTYSIYKFRWNTEENAKRYELALEFRYIEHTWADEEHTVLENSEEKVFTWQLGNVIAESSTGGVELEKAIDGISFFQTLVNNLEVSPFITREIGVLDNDVEQSHYSSFEFILTVGNSDINSYIEFSEPSTSLAQERPQFTNVNNGQGIFASRLTQKAVNVKMGNNTIRELCLGEIASSLNFCTKDPVYTGEQFHCN